MRLIIATLALALTSPAAASDRYSGSYASACGDLVCELDITPAGPDRWTIAWSAYDPTIRDARAVCQFSTEATIGSATMGPAGVVEGIAVGTVDGRPFGIFDLSPGRVSWSSSWSACPGVVPKAIYEFFGDE